VPDRVKPSFVIFDIRGLWRSDPVWHRMLYSCTHMATVKGLMTLCWHQLQGVQCGSEMLTDIVTTWGEHWTRWTHDIYNQWM